MVAGVEEYQGLRDPPALVRVITGLERGIAESGLLLRYDTDFEAFNRMVLALRGQRCGPFHDPQVSNLGAGRGFWMALDAADGRTVAVQAFRFDCIGDTLANWAPAFTIGLYLRRSELLIPTHDRPPANSISERISGRLVYHGELWIDRDFRGGGTAVRFGRLGLLLSMVKWQPDAIWALFTQEMAMRGVPLKLGYSHQERGFFRWQAASDGIDAVEWIAVADRYGLEQLVAEVATTPP